MTMGCVRGGSWAKVQGGQFVPGAVPSAPGSMHDTTWLRATH
jgi:hypothetical protein